MYLYQKNNRFTAQVADGLETPAAGEIQELGGTEIKTGYRYVTFQADLATLYRINSRARIISRVLAPLLRFQCHSGKYLYKTATSIEWSDFITLKHSLAVFANVSHSRVRHSKYAALKLKDAIVDQFRERTGSRPNIDAQAPDVWFHLHLENNTATISLDTSGGSLHRRGYRLDSVPAPMQETLAAAMITYTGWDRRTPLLDPMCGSGTLLCEALILAANIPAAYLRPHFGFELLPDFDPELWSTIREENTSQITSISPALISGSDMDPEAVQAAGNNCHRLPQGHRIRLQKARFQDLPGLEGGIVVCNPPYGRRLGHQTATVEMLHQLGQFLRQRCSKSTAFIYLGSQDLHRHLPLSPAWTKQLRNGGLNGCLAKYKIR